VIIAGKSIKIVHQTPFLLMKKGIPGQGSLL